jgi:hypothetical protein
VLNSCHFPYELIGGQKLSTTTGGMTSVFDVHHWEKHKSEKGGLNFGESALSDSYLHYLKLASKYCTFRVYFKIFDRLLAR